MINVTSNEAFAFTTVAALKAAISEARQNAKIEAARSCGRGTYISRGMWVRACDAKGDVVMGEADSWAFVATAKQLQELADLLRYDSRVADVYIEGGWNYALNPRDYADGAYDPLVGEWQVCLKTGKQTWA